MLKYKKLSNKRLSKKDKETAILLNLVELYIQTGKPIGSNTLKEDADVDFVSSATIRNYFSKLEKLGYLKQQHSSGGRIPTSFAFRKYVNHCLEELKIDSNDQKLFVKELGECKKVTHFLHRAADLLSELCSGCVFLLSPHFEQDFIQEIKLIKLDENTLLGVLITDFGQIKTETISIEKPLTEAEIKLIEKFLLWRISKAPSPHLSEALAKSAQKIYNEVMLRHVANYSSSNEAEGYRSGLSKLLLYPEFQDPSVLANTLALFEDFGKIKTLLDESMKLNKLTCWIGEELLGIETNATECSIIAFPYRINHHPVGALAILLPKRTDYPKVFALAELLSNFVSKNLTKCVYKFKIGFQTEQMAKSKRAANSIMLEDKSKI